MSLNSNNMDSFFNLCLYLHVLLNNVKHYYIKLTSGYFAPELSHHQKSVPHFFHKINGDTCIYYNQVVVEFTTICAISAYHH